MGVELSADVERRRIQGLEKRNVPSTNKWELYSDTSIVRTLRKAREMGWKEQRVQVRYVEGDGDNETYYIEPYEEGCGCKGLLKYKDFFD